MRLQSDVGGGCSHLKARLGLEETLLRWFSHVPGKLVLVRVEGLGSSPHGPLYMVVSPRVSDPREGIRRKP